MTEALQLRGHTIHVLTSRHGMNHDQPGGEVERRLLLNGVFDHPLVAHFGDLRAMEITNHRIFQDTVAQFQPDLIHVYSLAGLSKSLVFALRRTRRPTVYDVADDWMRHGLRTDPWLRWWNRPGGPWRSKIWRMFLERTGQRTHLDDSAPTRTLKGYDRIPQVYGTAQDLEGIVPNSITAFRFDRLYFCSHALKEATERAGFRVGHADVIYPGLQTQQYVGELKPSQSPVTKFLVVTPLHPECGVLTALRAVKMLADNQIPAALTVCGRGDSRYVAEVRSFVAQHRLPVEFISVSNPVKDLPAVYARHDALLHTPEGHEPFSLTPLEAMAAGLPIIATTVGGSGELFRHGENALTYPPADAETLAQRIQELQLQPILRCQMAENAQQDVLTNFNDSAVTDRVESYLQTSLSVWAHEAA